MSPNVAAGVTPDAGYNAPGGGSALVPADPTFALATAFPTTAATGAWWKLEQPATVDVDPLGTASVTRGVTAPVWFTGSTKVAKLAALAGLGYDTNPSISVAYLSYRFAKATIDAGSTLTFDFGSNSPDPAQTRLDIIARDGGGSSIIDTTNAKNSLLLYTGTWGVADSTTIVKPLTANAKQVGTFDLKAWVSARLLAGKAWSDVASVDITFVSVGTDDITERILYVSNFR